MTRPNVKVYMTTGINVKYIYSYITVIVTLIISSCGITPYRSEFACSLRDDFGKCISVNGAYEEAVTGVDSGAPSLSKKGKSVEPKTINMKSSHTSQPIESNTDLTNQTINASFNVDQYGAYRSSVYQNMRSMLTAPTAPILRPASTVRTLIISYADKEEGNRMYMPRYVFSISGSPEFVYGSYLDRRPGKDSGSLLEAGAMAFDAPIK